MAAAPVPPWTTKVESTIPAKAVVILIHGAKLSSVARAHGIPWKQKISKFDELD